MKKKVLGLIVTVIVVCASLAAFLFASSLAPTQQPTGALDFTVSGSSDCLRFLNSSVPTIYVPFTVAANENWQLTINCTKMSGGANGYTDVYVYNGYWNGGSNNTCTSSELYPIINDIQSTDRQIRLRHPSQKPMANQHSKATRCSLWFHQADNNQHST